MSHGNVYIAAIDSMRLLGMEGNFSEGICWDENGHTGTFDPMKAQTRSERNARREKTRFRRVKTATNPAVIFCALSVVYAFGLGAFVLSSA